MLLLLSLLSLCTHALPFATVTITRHPNCLAHIIEHYTLPPSNPIQNFHLPPHPSQHLSNLTIRQNNHPTTTYHHHSNTLSIPTTPTTSTLTLEYTLTNIGTHLTPPCLHSHGVSTGNILHYRPPVTETISTLHLRIITHHKARLQPLGNVETFRHADNNVAILALNVTNVNFQVLESGGDICALPNQCVAREGWKDCKSCHVHAALAVVAVVLLGGLYFEATRPYVIAALVLLLFREIYVVVGGWVKKWFKVVAVRKVARF